MMLSITLSCIAALLVVGAVAVFLGRLAIAISTVYSLCAIAGCCVLRIGGCG
jgi:hypothetical protein